MRKTILILGHNDATHFIDIFNQYACLFDPKHYEVTVAYLTGKPNEATRKRTIAEQVLFLDLPKKAIRYLKIGAILKLLTLCKKKRFEIVICHRYKPSYIMMWVAQFYHIPALVFVMHELKTMSHLGRQLVVAGLARQNMLFAGVSNAVRDDLRNSLGASREEKIITLYNAIDFNLIEPQLLSKEAARAALNLNTEDFIFGNLGRLVPNKDQATLIQAFALVKPYCPQAKLVIAGKGDLENHLKNQVKMLHLENDVIFTGFIATGFRLMKAFDCFVLSSVQEAFGRVLLEAMIAKIPLIATSANGIPEVVGEAGCLIKPRDVTGLAQAMQKIYETDATERAKQGDYAYQHALDHFSIAPFQAQFWGQPVLKELKPD